MSEAAVQKETQEIPITGKSILAGVVGWVFPGAGHLMLGKFGRGVTLMVSICTLFVLGLFMQGKVYSPNTGDILEMLGFISEANTGVLYVLARNLDWGHVAIATASADYGTKFLFVAGLLNVMAAVDAHHIALGKKS
jgi:TM2 domain-containing membrane protein YozV